MVYYLLGLLPSLLVLRRVLIFQSSGAQPDLLFVLQEDQLFHEHADQSHLQKVEEEGCHDHKYQKIYYYIDKISCMIQNYQQMQINYKMLNNNYQTLLNPNLETEMFPVAQQYLFSN